MHDDELDDIIADDEMAEDDAELSEQDENASVLSIRRGDGTEVVTIVVTGDEWNVHLQPGGGIRNAFVGSRVDSPIWVDSTRQIERDTDGTYVITVD
jgi:hypothetical protein